MKKKYVPPEIKKILFDLSFIKTSFENDGNDDWWDDENAIPNSF